MKLNFFLLAIAVFGIAGCDSGFTYKANLGNSGTTAPSLWAYVAPSAAGETLVLVGTSARPIPAAWAGVSTVKMIYNGQALPMGAGTVTSTGSVGAIPGVGASAPAGTRYYMTVLPSTLGYLNAQASDSVTNTDVAFVLNEHVEAASVSFTTSSPTTLP